MNIKITGRNLDLDPTLKRYITKKVSKFSRLYSRIMDAHVILEIEKSGKKAEIILQLRRNKVVAKESSNDIYASVDGAVAIATKQLKKLNGRVLAKRRKTFMGKVMKQVMFFRDEDEYEKDV